MSSPQSSDYRASIDDMIAAGRAGTPEVRAAAAPLILGLALEGHGNEAVWLLRDALVPSPRVVWDVLRGCTEFGRIDYLRWHRACVDTLVSSLLAFDVVLRPQPFVATDQVVTVVADTILWRNGLASRAERLGQALARRDSQRRGRIKEFHDYRRYYGWQTMYFPPTSEQAEFSMQVHPEEIWRSPEYDELWGRAYGDLTYDQYLDEFGEPSTAEVAQALPPGSCLVEYWWFIRSRDGQPPRREYLAVRLRNAAQPELALAELGPAAEIDGLIRRLVDRASGRGARGRLRSDAASEEPVLDRRHFDEPAARIRELVVDPLDVLDPGTPSLIVAPDGPLASVAFAALPTSAERYVLDTHVVSYVRSGADLVGSGSSPPAAATDPVVIGGPDFDLGARGASGEGFWEGLPGALDEARAVAEELGVPAVVGPDARVDRLLEIRSPRVLHVASHAGMLPADIESAVFDPRSQDHAPELVDSTAVYVLRDVGFLSGRRVPYQELRCVIALAGANTWLASGELGPETSTGHVNAEDILDLDLAATELVVLSACDSGRGVLHLEEGVVGLRSSIRLAGARSIVCSLWPVPDFVTADLMIFFYRQRKTRTPAEALRASQLHIRLQHPDEPWTWSAFICEHVAAPTRAA